MLNAENEDKAIGAYMQEFQDEGMTVASARAAIEAVLEHHEPIKHHFFSGIGLKLMFYDSQIASHLWVCFNPFLFFNFFFPTCLEIVFQTSDGE
jgi:hypothetical protein